MCFLRASRRTDRCVVALRGSEGWLGLLIKASSDVEDVVGSVNGYGIMSRVMLYGPLPEEREVAVWD